LLIEDFLQLKSHKVKDDVTEKEEDDQQPKRFNTKHLAEGFTMDE
jgi:hypothetical protein